MREKKVNIIKELQSSLSRSTIIIATDYRGLSTKGMTQLRRRFDELGAEFHVVKNTLARFAAQKVNRPGITVFFEGPTALVFGYGDEVKPARTLVDYIKSSEGILRIKGGLMRERLLTADEIVMLSSLPSWEVLISRVIGQMQSPFYMLVNILSAPLRGLLLVLQARTQRIKEEKGMTEQQINPSEASEEAKGVKPRGQKATPESASPAAKKLSKEELIATLKSMTVLELAELVKALEAEFGVSAGMVAVAPAPPVAEVAATAPLVEEKVEFAVILKDAGTSKINVIKAVREVTTLGLKEAKDLVESAPKPVKEAVSKEEATAIKQKLEAAGATVEIR